MKKVYLLAGALFAASGAFAQGAGHELFFSAYNEGAHPSIGPNNIPPGGGTASSGNEKAIQIFNPTNANVNMGAYSIVRYSNGVPDNTSKPQDYEEEKLIRNRPAGANNILASGDVFVYSNDMATLTDIITNTDQVASPYKTVTSTVIQTGGVASFNGDDAMALKRWTSGTAGVGTPVIVDIIGVIGDLPAGGAWYSNPPLVTTTVASRNMSLVRKPNISAGTTVNPAAATYQIGDQWDVYSAYNGVADPTGYFGQSYANLAGHAGRYNGTYGSYGALGVLEDFNNAITVYPNPATNKEVKIRLENTKVESITILNVVGQSIKVMPAQAASETLSVDISALKPGLYFVKFVAADENHTTIYKELLVR